MGTNKLKKLLDIGRQLAETRELDPLLESAMGLALGFLGAEFGYLVLLDNDKLVFRVGQDENGNHLKKEQGEISRTIFDQVITGGTGIIVADAMSSLDTESVIELKIRSVMCAPLISRGKIIGAIYVENRSAGNLFNAEDLIMLEYFSAQAAVSLENAMLNDDLQARVAARTEELTRANAKLHEIAITDSLTGLFNRRYFFELAAIEIARANRYKRPLSAIMIDLDHFKEINDQFGHFIGDQVLRGIAERLRICTRDVDVLGRYGGEEFTILLSDTDPASAARVAERLCLKINSQPIKINDTCVAFTASLGVANHEVDQEITIDVLLDQADQALYAAKNAGRNRVSLYQKK